MAGNNQENKSFFSSFSTMLSPFIPKAGETHSDTRVSPRRASDASASSAASSHASAAQPPAHANAVHANHADHAAVPTEQVAAPKPRGSSFSSILSPFMPKASSDTTQTDKDHVSPRKGSDAKHAEPAHHAETSGPSDVAVQLQKEAAAEGNVAHPVIQRVDTLGSLDQQKSDEIEKAIEAAEAETAVKLEKIKSDKKVKEEKPKEGEEQEGKTWLARTRDNIKYTFISKETEEAFGEISILFDKIFDDFPYNKVDLMFGLMMLDDYYKNAPILSADRVQDLEFIDTARFYMKFAYCCYGWKFVYGILNRKTNKFLQSMVGWDANIKAIFDCTGVEPKDIIVSKFTSSVFDPGHYICLCHDRKTIVVAFRGTFHIRDALTDLVASNAPFMQGSAHTGLLRTANNKFRLLAPVILKCFEENPTYKVVVVGHSLGAGTASLFSLIFHEAHPEVPLHCFAYAPPGVVSPDVALASSTTQLIDSIVVGTDIVPRLSFATLTHLKKVIMQILSSGNNTFQRGLQWMTGGMGDGMKKTMTGMLKIPETAKVEPTPVPLSDISIFPPGRLILLVPHTLKEENEEKEKGKEEDGDSGSDSEHEKEEKAEKEHLRKERNKESKENGEEMRSVSPSPATSPLSSSPPDHPAPSHPTPSLPVTTPSTPSTTSTTTTSITTTTSTSTTTSTTHSTTSTTPATTTTSTLAPSSFANPLRRLSQTFSPAKLNFFSTSSSSSANGTTTVTKEVKPKKKKTPKPKTVYLMEYSNSSLFNEIIISPSMFTCHMPSAYDKALDSCLQTMLQLKSTPSIIPNFVVKLDEC